MTERGVAATGTYSTASTTPGTSVIFGGSVVSVQNTQSSTDTYSTTWEHPVRWSDIRYLLEKIPNFNFDEFINLMSQNANSLEDYLDGALLKTSGGIAQGKILTPAIGCKLQKAVVQSLTTGTATAITFGASDTEVFDTDGFHSTTTNTSRITIPTGLDGVYIVTAGAGFAVSATGARYVSIYKSGTQDANTRIPANAVALSQTLVTTSTVLQLSAGDYVEMYCFQNSGGALDVTAGTWSSLSVVFLGT
jgi:hypothetical protein